MKAKIKATGEIVGILPYAEEDGNVRFYANMEDKWYEAYEIDLVSETSDPDYWTRLEHQYAGMAMQGIVSSYEAMREISKERDIPQYVANMAFGLAHALVEKLKEKEERK